MWSMVVSGRVSVSRGLWSDLAEQISMVGVSRGLWLVSEVYCWHKLRYMVDVSCLQSVSINVYSRRQQRSLVVSRDLWPVSAEI